MENISESVCAIMSTYLGDSQEGDMCRKYSGKCEIKDEIEGKTYINGLLHSFDDKPAMIGSTGTKYWYYKGKQHREEGKPAVEYADGSMLYFNMGVLVRIINVPEFGAVQDILYSEVQKRLEKEKRERKERIEMSKYEQTTLLKNIMSYSFL
jgi:hypothetical protein